MRRREFISLVGGAVVAWPLAARAQQKSKRRQLASLQPSSNRIGRSRSALLSSGCANSVGSRARPSRSTIVGPRGTASASSRSPRNSCTPKADIIVTGGNAVAAVKQATSTIPIVFAVAVDPVGSGFVDSLSRPGGNVIGLSLEGPDLAGKRLELLREVARGSRRLAILANVGYAATKLELAQVRAAAPALGFEPFVLEIRRGEDIALAFDNLNDRADALYIVAEALVNSNLVPISTLAIDARLPTVFGSHAGARVGGLISYGPNFSDLFRRTADLVDKILRGAKPDDIPVEQPTKFKLVVNLKTAKALGLTVPPTIIATADEVIE